MIALTPVEEKFILHWGEMGNKWGINRTVAQIHALLYVSPRPLNAEEIAGTLSVARSNVSTSLKELQGWGIVKPVHVLGDRREHYETLSDIWEMARVVMDERKRREIDPTLNAVRECVAELKSAPEKQPHTETRLVSLLDFLETMDTAYQQSRKLPTATLIQLFKMDNRLDKLLSFLKK